MARQWYGFNLQGRGLMQAAGASATIVPSATTSYYAALTYGMVGWVGCTAGAMLRIREVDSTSSNTVWIGYLNAAQGVYNFEMGEEGIKASSLISGYHLDTDSAGTVWACFNGFQSRTNA